MSRDKQVMKVSSFQVISNFKPKDQFFCHIDVFFISRIRLVTIWLEYIHNLQEI